MCNGVCVEHPPYLGGCRWVYRVGLRLAATEIFLAG